MTVEMAAPCKYEIEAHDLGDGKWILNYKEYFTEDIWTRAREDSKEVFDKLMGVPYEMNDEEKSFSFTLTASKNRILNMLAGEFLGFSSLGNTTLKDLFATFAFAIARGVGKIEDEK